MNNTTYEDMRTFHYKEVNTCNNCIHCCEKFVSTGICRILDHQITLTCVCDKHVKGESI